MLMVIEELCPIEQGGGIPGVALSIQYNKQSYVNLKKMDSLL